MGRLAGAVVGAAFFVWIAGTRALDPGEIGWLMRYDWPIHFFGWHFFRSEPWHWPPGLIDTYYAPLGTAIGFTDSIPLVALALKPIAAWLPATFQYIGPWLFLCFALQGLFGAWLMQRWTPRIALQAAGAALVVLMPILLIRIGHPALCAHWLILWALVIAVRDADARFRVAEWGALGLVCGLVHPYLAVMVLALLTGVALGRAPVSRIARPRALAGAMLFTIIGWWMSGLFSVSGAGSMATEGLGHYSMNLLGPIMPVGWSLFLPDIPRATAGQDFEGLQYLGLGVLLLIAIAVVVSLRGPTVGPTVSRPDGERRSRSIDTMSATAVGMALLMATYALSPRITLANLVLVDLTGPWTGPFAVFRATGRFFWPLAYVLVAWALATVVRRWPSRVALSLVVGAVLVQALDLHGAHEQRRGSARDPAFYAWSQPMVSAVWARVLPEYDHLVLYPPPQCGVSPVRYEPAAYAAGLYGLTINAGDVARPDQAARLRYCHDLGDQLKTGTVDDRTFYIVLPAEVDALKQAAREPVACGVIDTLSVCVTAASYQRWRDAAPLD